MFDVVSYLESRGVDYWTSGNNVSAGWIAICCPYCDDKTNHLGINLSKGHHSCWKCGANGTPIKLIAIIDNCSWKEAYKTCRAFETEEVPEYQEYQEQPTREVCKLPIGLLDNLPTRHRQYLIDRGFDPDVLQDEYHIKATMNIGPYRHRIIIPIHYQREVVNFVARDITGNFDKRYLMAPSRDVKIKRQNLLYGIDDIKQSVVIVEGIFDAWRVGKGAVATFGTRVTNEQLNLLCRKKIQRAFVCFDSDAARTYGHELTKKLSYIIPHVENVIISEGDPDSYFLNNSDDLKSIQFLLK